ncbi:hypothetical protein OKW34_007068 [Paraburkholderia youngii]
MLELFARLSPNPATHTTQKPWALNSGAILRTRAVYSIAMIGLCACVFSGLLTFQMSLVQGTGSRRYVLQLLYRDGRSRALAARTARGQFAARNHDETRVDVEAACHCSNVRGSVSHALSPDQRRAVRNRLRPRLSRDPGTSRQRFQCHHRHAALTWFIVAYSLGAFGFPAVGGWVLVHAGRSALTALIAICGMSALVLSVLRDRRSLTAQFRSRAPRGVCGPLLKQHRGHQHQDQVEIDNETLPSRLVQAVTRGDAFCSALAQRKITTTCRPASPSASPTWSASTAAVARAPETTRRKRQRRQQPRRNVE